MDFSRLSEYIDTLGTVYDVPYGELRVVKGYEEVYHKTFGTSDNDRKVPAKPDMLQWIYSMTKVVTCTAGFILVDRGLLDLDAPVYKYLPEFKNLQVLKDGKTVPAQTIMQVRHLFSMRAGLSYDLYSPHLKKARENKNATTRELVKAIAKDPLMFNPGTEYAYSLAHDVIAAIIETVSGTTFYEFLKKEIIEPLGMNKEDIGFHPTAEQLKRFAAQFRYDALHYKFTPISLDCTYTLSDLDESGGAGLFCSNANYMKLVKTLCNNGVAENGYVLLKPETLDIFTTDTLTEETERFNRPGYGYAHGVRVLRDKNVAESLSAVGEFGWDGAANSYCLIDRKNNVGIVYTTQLQNFGMGYTEIHPKLRNLAYMAMGIE